MILSSFINFLSHHQDIVYIILFLGSMFETIIGFSFFVYGEIFFLAGSIMAGSGILNIYNVALSLYLGAILGDNISYFIGRKYGKNIYYTLRKINFLKKYINKKNYVKSAKFLQKKGAMSLFFARLLGPLSWIMPFIAGIYKIDYKKFLIFNTLGIIVGIGEFIVVGYFFGMHYKEILTLLQKYFWVIIIFIIIFFMFKKFIRIKK